MRRTLLPVAAAMAAVLVAMAVAWALTRSDDDPVDAVAAPPETTPTTEPAPTTTTTEPGPAESGDDELDEAVEELSAFVEEERGLEFLEPVEVELADDEEFERFLLEDFEAEDEQEIRDSEAIFQALGLIDPDVDLVEQVRGFLAVGVVGAYDPEDDRLLVRSTELTPYTRQTIAHELTHALDDQHFELFRPELDDVDDESGFGFDAVTEGNATRIDEAFESELSPEERDELREEEAAVGSEADFGEFPEILINLIAAPYDLGPVLVEAILDDGGQEALDAAFEEPPTTSEQVLDPTRFLEGEGAVPVDVPEADGEPFDDGMFGQLVLILLLENGGVSVEDAQRAVLGWGGDQYVAWREGERTCIRVAFATDTPADLPELTASLEDWAAAQPDATVTPSSDLVTFTSCG
ncbi:MAG TPA: hypothetical protein VD926_12455 [Acidimicrobiales bacterium]|nr:hypothetical protein [Acidimicrobiales bacterium]